MMHGQKNIKVRDNLPLPFPLYMQHTNQISLLHFSCSLRTSKFDPVIN